MMDNSQILEARLQLDVFNQVPTEHGQEFDDGRRWCGICLAPKLVCTKVASDPWAHKMCATCTALWPEFVIQIKTSFEDYDENEERDDS